MSRDLLLVPMQENDAGAATVGGYLHALLRTLWREGESFSGKRPFGNSGWESELHRALIAAGKVEGGELDEDGFVDKEGNANDVVLEAIDALFAEHDATAEAEAIIIAALKAEVAKREEKED